MDKIKDLAALLLILLPAAAAPRAIYCFVKMVSDEELSGQYKTRLKNLLIFTVLAAAVFEFIILAYSYYFA